MKIVLEKKQPVSLNELEVAHQAKIRDQIITALAAENHNLRRSAKVLGLNEWALRRRILKLGIPYYPTAGRPVGS